MKKKISKIAGLVLAATLILAGCSTGNNDSDSGKKSSTETFQTTTVYNPNTTKVKLIAVSSSRAAEGEEVCEVEPKTKIDVELGSEHDYYFTDKDGKKIADLAKADDGRFLPVYLELNEPKEGSKYLLLNEYKQSDYIDCYTRWGDNTYNTYQLFLYEIVEQSDIDSYKYTDSATNKVTYIKTYPSANLWINNKDCVSSYIGNEITFNLENFENEFAPLSDEWVAWGWSTKDPESNIWFCHRLVSCILKAKGTYTGKDIEVKGDISFYNPTQNAISLYDSSNNEIATVDSKSSLTKKITLEVPFHFNDGNCDVTISPFRTNNFILKYNEPIEGNKYLCLNQNKRTDLRNDNSGNYWELCLFEVVDSTADYSYKYSDNVYIRSYPSAFLWINNKDFVTSQLGQELTFSNNLFSMFTPGNEWLDWGWSSKINNTWYENILPTMVLNINK